MPDREDYFTWKPGDVQMMDTKEARKIVTKIVTDDVDEEDEES